MRFHVIFFVAVVLVGIPCYGQNVYLDEIYGDGVHAYFRGEIDEAQAQFDRAIRHGSRDPRVYYFRAIMRLNCGDPFLAEEDIRTAVTYELQGRGTYDVGRSLERIQGPERLELEQFRQVARLELRGQPSTHTMPNARPMIPGQLPLDKSAPLPDSPFKFGEGLDVDSSDLDLDRPQDQKVETGSESKPKTEAPADKPDPFADDAEPSPNDPAVPPQSEAPVPSGEVAPADDPFADDPFATDDDSPF